MNPPSAVFTNTVPGAAFAVFASARRQRQVRRTKVENVKTAMACFVFFKRIPPGWF